MNLPVTEDSILDRWAHLIVEMVDADSDPATMADWAHRVHMGTGTLRELCRAAGVRGKQSLDFARVLRAVVRLENHPWVPEAVLSCHDPRTLRALLSRTGCVTGQESVTADDYLARQAVLPRDGCHLSALRQALAKKRRRNSGTS